LIDREAYEPVKKTLK
jgi:hypothetical protein